jgi:acetolactate synthase-1/2/3 large subunit
VFNNASYGAIEITQKTFFKQKFGVDSTSGLSFPDTGKIASAYGIHYIRADTNNDLEECFTKFINHTETVILEVFCCLQVRYPKISSIKNEDGSFSSLPFEDMEPFLSREEFNEEMIVKSLRK